MQQPATLTITLHRLGGGTGGVGATVTPPPALPLDRLFGGLTAAEAAERAGLVFNICGAAQSAATAAALGAAPRADAPRRMLIETLRDHALKLAVIWPETLGMAPEHDALGAVASLPGDDGTTLRAALFGPEGLPRDLAGFETWMQAGATAPARVLAHVWQEWSPDWGKVRLPLWPGLSAAGIDFARAEWRGGAFESGLPALHADAPLLVAIAAKQGRSLVWRLAARLVDAAVALDALAGRAAAPVPRALGEGVGAAPAARGTMLVRGTLEKGRVTGLSRLSPTDAALHEDGLLARMLATLPAEADAPSMAVAALMVEAADPCLPHIIRASPPGEDRRALGRDPKSIEENINVHRLRLLG